MSFILDALRKSEHERQRGSGPGIAEVAVARRADRASPWAATAVGLLLLNLLVFGAWMLSRALREPATERGEAATVAAERSVAAPTITAEPAPGARAPLPRETPPPMLRPAAPAPRSSLAEEAGGIDEVAPDPALVAAASAPPVQLPQDGEAPEPATVRSGGGRVVYETQPLDAPPVGSPAPRTQGLPTAEELATQAGIPELHLDIHVYSTVASERFVFVNGAKYREGESLQAGPTVESITPEGVILSHRGSRFVLPRP